MSRHYKGRNSELIVFRNRKLAARFYWYSSLIGLRFEKCVDYLQQEFDLSQSRIEDLLRENADFVSQLEIREADVQFLRSLYPFFSWQYVPATKSRSGVQLSLDLFSDCGS